MMTDFQPGAVIERGPTDWQIIQQDADGLGSIELAGRWAMDTEGVVEVRLVHQNTGSALSPALDWRPVDTKPDGRWSGRIDGIPAGGLYRLETRFNPEENLTGEWSTRGDMRHFLGVGDLWVIAGQSNSAGYGRGPYADPPELGVHLFRNSETWALATHPLNESTDIRHPANREGGNPAHSPYLHFGRLLQHALGHPIGLVQTSLGGSPLSEWNPTEPGPSSLFENMVHCVQLVGGRVKGVLWYQGESDCAPEAAPSYEDRFCDAVAAWQEAIGDLHVITVQLNRVYGPQDDTIDLGWSTVREAQRRVPERLGTVSVVPALDLPLGDGIHVSPGGHMLLAERMARAALSPTTHQAPNVRSASCSGTTVELLFDNVRSRMDCIDTESRPFRVEDEEGVVPIERIVYPGGNRILVVLARELACPAYIHGAYGSNPPIAPMDAERFLPMLGFLGVPIG